MKEMETPYLLRSVIVVVIVLFEYSLCACVYSVVCLSVCLSVCSVSVCSVCV